MRAPAALLALALAVAPPSTAAPLPPPHARIAFERDNGVWVADSAGQHARRVARGNLPELSPDGTRVAYTTDEPSRRTPVRHIAVLDLETGRRVEFRGLAGDNAFGPHWSPDGTQIAFSTYVKGWNVALADSGGHGVRLLLPPRGFADAWWEPRWASDGAHLYVHTLDTLACVGLDAHFSRYWPIHAITPDGDMNSNSAVSATPDGTALLVELDMNEEANDAPDDWDGPPVAIWRFDLASGSASRLTPQGSVWWNPFALGGGGFLFQRRGKGDHATSVWRAPGAGGPPVRIAAGAENPSAAR